MYEKTLLHLSNKQCCSREQDTHTHTHRQRGGHARWQLGRAAGDPCHVQSALTPMPQQHCDYTSIKGQANTLTWAACTKQGALWLAPRDPQPQHQEGHPSAQNVPFMHNYTLSRLLRVPAPDAHPLYTESDVCVAVCVSPDCGQQAECRSASARSADPGAHRLPASTSGMLTADQEGSALPREFQTATALHALL